jgi:hypothetical protein
MIKADRNAFYGRILQVVNYSKVGTEEEPGIKNFAFVTDPKTSQEARQILEEKEK